jgi:hypothetical protein
VKYRNVIYAIPHKNISLFQGLYLKETLLVELFKLKHNFKKMWFIFFVIKKMLTYTYTFSINQNELSKKKRVKKKIVKYNLLCF